MSDTLEQIKTAVLNLPHDQRDALIDDLVEANISEVLDTDRQTIDTTLKDRLKGPFVPIDDPESYFEERKRHHRQVLKKTHG